jgi:hypothetical protein
MRREIALFLVLGLASCTDGQTSTTGTGTASSVVATADPRAGFAASGKSFAKKICGFVPTAKTVLDILDLGVPGLSKASAIAGKICDVVNTKGLGPPTFKSVRIEGHYE